MSDEDVWVQLSVALTEIESLWGVLAKIAVLDSDLPEARRMAHEAVEESRRNLVDRLNYGTKA